MNEKVATGSNRFIHFPCNSLHMIEKRIQKLNENKEEDMMSDVGWIVKGY